MVLIGFLLLQDEEVEKREELLQECPGSGIKVQSWRQRT
jgi:hypothetical protein